MEIVTDSRARLSARDWDYIAHNGPGTYEIDGQMYRARQVSRGRLELLAIDEFERAPRGRRREPEYDDGYEPRGGRRYDDRDRFDDRDHGDDEVRSSRSRRAADDEEPIRSARGDRSKKKKELLPPETKKTVRTASKIGVVAGGVVTAAGVLGALFSSGFASHALGGFLAVGVPVTAASGVGLYVTRDVEQKDPPKRRGADEHYDDDHDGYHHRHDGYDPELDGPA